MKKIGNRIELIKLLGEGNYARVYIGRDLMHSNRMVAVKEIHLKNSANLMIQNEVHSLQKIRDFVDKIKQSRNGVLNTEEQEIIQYSKHILEIMDPYCFNENEYTYIITKFYENSIDFSQFLKTNDALNKLSERDILRYFYQLTCGLSVLHQQNIYHRDLKLENILINQDSDELIIIDFGHALIKRADEVDMCGTKLYNSPQVVLNMSYNAQKNDVWQMGVILYYLIHKRFPFCEINQGELELQQAVNDFMQRKRDITINQNVSQFVKELLQSILQRHEDSRPQIAEVNKKLKDYLFQKIPIQNFKGASQKEAKELRQEALKFITVLDCDFSNIDNIKKVQVFTEKQQSQQNIMDQNKIIVTQVSNQNIYQPDYNNQPYVGYYQKDNQQRITMDSNKINASQVSNNQNNYQPDYNNQPFIGSYQKDNSFYKNEQSKVSFISGQENQNNNQNHDFISEIRMRKQNRISKTEIINGNNQNQFNFKSNLQQQKSVFVVKNNYNNLYNNNNSFEPFRWSISTASSSINQDIDLNSIFNQFNESVQKIEEILKSSQIQNNQSLEKKLLYIKFYIAKLTHFLGQSLLEYAQYEQNKEWQCLYTNNFLVQWMIKINKDALLLQNKTQNYIECIKSLKQIFSSTSQKLQKNSIDNNSSQLQSALKNNQSNSMVKSLEQKFANHSQDNYMMSNTQHFLDFNNFFNSILEYTLKQINNNQFQIQEEDKQIILDIIQKVRNQSKLISQLTYIQNLNDQLLSFNSSSS